MASLRYSKEGAVVVFLVAAALVAGYAAYDAHSYDTVLKEEFLGSMSVDLAETHPSLTVKVRCDRVGITHVMVTSLNSSGVSRQVESIMASTGIDMDNEVTFRTVQATQINITAIDNVEKLPLDKPCHATLKSPR